MQIYSQKSIILTSSHVKLRQFDEKLNGRTSGAKLTIITNLSKLLPIKTSLFVVKIVQIGNYCQLKTACCLPYRQVVEFTLNTIVLHSLYSFHSLIEHYFSLLLPVTCYQALFPVLHHIDILLPVVPASPHVRF